MHFLYGEHHDQWYCQSAVAKSGSVGIYVGWAVIIGKLSERCSGVYAFVHAIGHWLSTGLSVDNCSSWQMAWWATVVRITVQGTGDCGLKFGSRAHYKCMWGVVAVCLWSGLIVVLPAQSGSGGSLILDGIVDGILCVD